MDSTVTDHRSLVVVKPVGRSAATHAMVAGVLALVVLGWGMFHLESFPPLWFDEGWTTCTARTWVERGHYGCLLQGEPAPPLLSAHFPVVASVAASFHLFGVGVWQARMVGLLYTYGAFLLLYYLADRLYGRKVALATLILVILFPLKWQIHPLIVGRQVLGEMPLVFFLLAGCACLLHTERHRIWLVAAVFCWGIAWMTKAQAAPFLAASFGLSLLLAARRREWLIARWLVIGLVGSWAGYHGLLWTKDHWLAGHTIPHPHLKGLAEAIAVVFVPSIRMETIQLTVSVWPEYTVALGYTFLQMWRPDPEDQSRPLDRTVRTLLILLAGSWLAWFALLCAGEPRYALPGLFVAAPCTAAFFAYLTRNFDRRHVGRTLAASARSRRLDSEGRRVLLAIGLLLVMIWVGVHERYAIRAREDDRDLMTVTAFLHTHTPPSALIETYDSELFLLLNRPYTYAPPDVLVDIIRHHQHVGPPVTYDPLGATPDYLVVGDFGRWAGFYKPLVEQNRVRLVKIIGRYQIYEPVRS
jgi:4-amino-4-deoxy-L-arabinose transferase-like glycosyltransferase